MKKYLLPKEGAFYKANLHTHTTVSDGKFTPEEIKKVYSEQGYSIVAFTDHEVMVPHTELTDDNFLAITGVEVGVTENGNYDFLFKKCYHLNLYSKNPYRTAFSTFNEKDVVLEHSRSYVTEEQKKYCYERTYSIDCVNEMIKMANDEECFVSLNHPVWSLQNYVDYISLNGLWAVEWYNNGVSRWGLYETFQPIDDLLRIGKHVYPIATDDTHIPEDRFGGFVMVKSPVLKYEEVYEALKKGDFYSSENPLIEELSIENGIIHIKTSEVKRIIISAYDRCGFPVNAKEGKYLTDEYIDLNWFLRHAKENQDDNSYIRITIIDEFGRRAYTRAYLLSELS